MVKRKPKEIVEILKGLLRQQGIHPYRIIFFGSYLKSQSLKQSDIDIIVLSKDFEGKDIFEKVKMVVGVHRKLIRKLMTPADIMYYSLSEWRRNNSPIIRTAKEEGFIYS